MLTLDDSRWPIVTAHFQGSDTLPEMQQFLEHFESWLKRREPFALIIRRDQSEAAEAKGKLSDEAKRIRKISMDWNKTHKSDCSQYCVGIAMVPDSTKMLAIMRPVATKVIQSMYGCPGNVFASVEEAETWTKEKLGILTPVPRSESPRWAIAGVIVAIGSLIILAISLR